jgi:membrane-associated HD superfamily phosphohydrolase
MTIKDIMKNKVFLEGMRDGLPIGLGYFAVAFSLGIVARNAGLTPFQGFIASFFCVASAGEYALFTSIQTAASFVEIALITLVVNARYLLMSTALTQRFDPKTPLIHRFLIGFGADVQIVQILPAVSNADRNIVFPEFNRVLAVPDISAKTAVVILQDIADILTVRR